MEKKIPKESKKRKLLEGENKHADQRASFGREKLVY